MKTIAFYSYKGGTGRSLLLVNTALFLAGAGKRVVMLDLDIEAPGLHHKFGFKAHKKVPRIPMERGNLALGEVGPGSIELLLKWQTDVEFIVEEYLYEIELEKYLYEIKPKESKKGSLHLIPAGAAPSRYYASLLEKLNWRKLNRKNEKDLIPSAEGVKKLKKALQYRLNPAVDYLLVDARTGMTDVGALALYGMADTAVCLFTTIWESMHGSARIMEGLFRTFKPKEFDLRLMSAVNDANEIPTQGKNLVILARVGVDKVLHFRIFDTDRKRVVDTSEKSLQNQARQVEELKNQLNNLWTVPELSKSDKDRVISSVTSIVGHTQPKDVVAVLSRVPEHCLVNPDFKETYREKLNNEINEDAKRGSHLPLQPDDLVVIRSDPLLEAEEKPLIASRQTLRESLVIIDYLRFFDRLKLPPCIFSDDDRNLFKLYENYPVSMESDLPATPRDIKGEVQKRGLRYTSPTVVQAIDYKSFVDDVIDQLCKAAHVVRPKPENGFDLRLMSLLNDVSGIPTEGENLIIVAAVNNVLHFRIFDGDGKVVVDTDERGLTEQARQIEDLREQLKSLWPPHELIWSDKDRVSTAVTSIIGHIWEKEDLSFGVIALRMADRALDFCSDPYYLTPTRSRLVGVLPFGRVKFFGCAFTGDICDFRSGEPEPPSDESEPPILDLEKLLVQLEERPDCNIGLLGETAASSEVLFHLLDRLKQQPGRNNELHGEIPSSGEVQVHHSDNKRNNGRAIFIAPSKSKLEAWVKEQQRSIVIADIDILETLKMRVSFKVPFRDERGHLAGIAYPLGDNQWRSAIAMAVAKVLEARGNDLVQTWKKITSDFSRVGIKPLDGDKLLQELLLDMSRMEAKVWRHTLEKLAFYKPV